MGPRVASLERQAGVQRRRQYALHKDEATLVDYTGLLMKERKAHCNTARSIIRDKSTNALEHQRQRDAGEAAWDRHVELLEGGTITTYADVKTDVLEDCSWGDNTSSLQALKVDLELKAVGLDSNTLPDMPTRNAMKGIRGVLAYAGPVILHNGSNPCTNCVNCVQKHREASIYEARRQTDTGQYKALQVSCGQSVSIGVMLGDKQLVFTGNCFRCMTSNIGPCSIKSSKFTIPPEAMENLVKDQVQAGAEVDEAVRLERLRATTNQVLGQAY